MRAPGRDSSGPLCVFVQEIAFGGELLVRPDLLDVNQRAPPLAKTQMLKRREGQQAGFIVHDTRAALPLGIQNAVNVGVLGLALLTRSGAASDLQKRVVGQLGAGFR